MTNTIKLKATMGQRVRALRKENRMTLDHVANAAGLSKSHLHAIEHDTVPQVGAKIVHDLATLFGVSMEHIFSGIDETVLSKEDSKFWMRFLRATGEQKEYLHLMADVVWMRVK